MNAPARAAARAELAMVLVVLIWGANFAFIKLALREIPAFSFAALRFTLATVALLLVVRLREGSARFPPGTLVPLLLLGFLGNTAYQALFMLGMTRTSASNSALILSTTPVLVALLARMSGVERLSRQTVFGIAFAFGGVLCVFWAKGVGLSSDTVTGDLFVLGATLCWATFTLGVRALRPPITTLRLTALTMVTGTPGLMLLAAPEFGRFDWSGVSMAGWTGVAYSTVLGIVVAYGLWNNSVRLVGGSRTAVFSSGIPVVAMLVAWPLLGEQPLLLQLAGAVLIIAGVLLARRPGPTTPRTVLSSPAPESP